VVVRRVRSGDGEPTADGTGVATTSYFFNDSLASQEVSRGADGQVAVQSSGTGDRVRQISVVRSRRADTTPLRRLLDRFTSGDIDLRPFALLAFDLISAGVSVRPDRSVPWDVIYTYLDSLPSFGPEMEFEARLFIARATGARDVPERLGGDAARELVSMIAIDSPHRPAIESQLGRAILLEASVGWWGVYVPSGCDRLPFRDDESITAPSDHESDWIMNFRDGRIGSVETSARRRT